jgi:hypothetical protein
VQNPTERDHVIAALAQQLSDAATVDSSKLLLPVAASPLAGHSRRIDHPPQA